MKRSKKKSPSLRSRLFRYLALFAIFGVVLLWLFQVLFMDAFYLTVTTKGLSKRCDSLAQVCTSHSDINTAVYEASDRTGFCISVYGIKGGVGSKIAEAHVRNGCYIHSFLTGDGLRELYSDTRDSGGELVRDILEGAESKKKLSSIMYSRIVHGEKGEEFLLILNADSYPESTLTVTVTVQLAIITIIFIIGAVVLAAVMSRKISRPVSALCVEAEQLATGDYVIETSPSGIAELDRLSNTLSFAAGELSHADTMNRELVANITHDLRTPLTLISGYGEVMRDIPGEITPENMQVIIDESHRLSALVSDVLEMSRLRNGQIELNLTEFDLTASVKAETERYATLLAPTRFHVTYENDGNVATIRGDEGKLLQVLCNLLNNAANFTGDKKKIIVRQFIRDGICRTEVQDFGMGIPEDELPTIWDRYYRARDRHNKGIPGTGLGLAIVKELLLAHGAEFGVSSAPGHGSIFWFEFPVEKKDE